MSRLFSIPAKDGFYMPGEYAGHYGTFMIWPERPGSWAYEGKGAKTCYCEIIKNLSEEEKVFLFASEAGGEEASKMLKTAGLGNKLSDDIIIYNIPADDAWARDTGATFLLSEDGKTLRGVDWEFNAWGGNFDGLYSSWEKDREVAGKLCEILDVDCYDARDFVLEGGSIHTDGEGTVITTEECLLSPGRNPSMTKAEIEDKLKNFLGAKKVIWLPYGIYNDETNGHVDNICCFSEPGKVLLAWRGNNDDPQHERSHKALKILENERDAKGRPLQVTKLPIPKNPVIITEEDLKGLTFEEGEAERTVGERLAASYINFYIGNKKVIVPQFGDTNDSVAMEILSNAFPDRRVVPIYARDILVGGGNIHCITQQIPATR